ncbi:ABC transporter permease subunit [Actinopolymorpha pittospori]
MYAVMRSEWAKLRTIRSTAWALALTFVISVGLAWISGFSVRNAYDSGNADLVRPDFDPIYSGFVGLLYGQLSLVVFGVLLVGTEFGSGTIRMTLTAVPQRGRLFAGKVAAGMGAALLVSILTAFVSWPANQAGLGPYGAAMSDPGVARAVVGAALYLTLVCALAIGVATVVRSSALALVILVPLFYVVEPILGQIRLTEALARYLPGQAGAQVMTVGPPKNGALEPGQGLLVLVAWTATALVAGYLSLRHRDV